MNFSLLLLLCYGAGNVRCSTLHGNSTDLMSLLDFKNRVTSDPYGALNSWTTSTHFCQWSGVNCSSTPPYRVTELNLPGKNLDGNISSALGNLTSLRKLDLSDNRFGGPIPILGKLQHLNTLYLGGNHLQGVIPETLTNCSNLAVLNLSLNNLNCVIPPKIRFLSNLETHP